MNNPAYVYTSSEKETKRLNTQSDLIKTSSIEHLKKAGLKTGQTVVDMGCGSGAMTVYLAEQVGPTGHVIAIDIDEKQLEVTRKTLAEKNITNVTFIQCDIMGIIPAVLTDMLKTVDLIYMRFVLMHLKNPYIAIRNLRSLLKVGGRIANQESIIGSTHCEPIDSVEIREAYGVSLNLGIKLGTDKNIGGKLLEQYENAGFKYFDENYKVTHSIPMGDAAPVMLASGDAAHKALMLEHGVTTEDQFEKHKAEITRLGQVNDRSLVFDQGYIVAVNL